MTPAGSTRRLPLWILGALLGLFLFAASAPSPLYAIYAARWIFSPITLTAIYAVYAAGALSALLVTGRLSDYLGRRRVVIFALALQMVALGAFLAAHGTALLFVARIVQGAATGIASGAISAWLVDLQPADKPTLGGLISGIALLAGLGGGGVGAGLLVQYAPDPLHLVYWILAGVFALFFGAVFVVPDVVERSRGAAESMRPQVGVPIETRGAFAALAPSLIAMWALSGFYLALGPSIAVSLLQTNNRLAGGLVIFALMGSGAVGSGLARRIQPRPATIEGCVLLVAGVAVTLIGLATESALAFYGGSAIAGLGLGPAFSGILRTLGSLAPAEKRGALFGATYILVYVSISVPTVLAGMALTRTPLTTTTYVYGLAVMVLTAVTTIAISRKPLTPL